MSAHLSLQNVAWSAPDGRPVLSGITASFAQECIGIVGRNGVGKSTLLSLMAGRQRPTSGRVIVHGSVAVLRQFASIPPH